MRSKESDEQRQDLDKHSTLKAIITILVLIACWALWFLLERSWVTILVLSIGGCLAAEYLGFKLLSRNKWFEQLSVEHSGFSIWRIILAVIGVVLIAVVIILARLLFLRVFY